MGPKDHNTPRGDAASQPAVPDAGAEDDLLVAAARANPREFTALYRRYVGPVHRYCALRLGSREAAEDAASEVFLKAMSGLSGFRGGVFAGWLFRIAHNVVVDYQRQGRRAFTGTWPDPTPDLADAIVDTGQTPEELTIARSDADALYAALATLPDDQRATIELQLAGWSSEQIGAALGKSANAVRVLRYRAMQTLRDRLERAASSAPSLVNGGRR
jgi:RNA polymerase sigma-70 factor (ECF subfamily)